MLPQICSYILFLLSFFFYSLLDALLLLLFFTYLQVLLANACPCGSATSFFFVIVFIEICKYILIEVAAIYYYRSFKPTTLITLVKLKLF